LDVLIKAVSPAGLTSQYAIPGIRRGLILMTQKLRAR